jgi:hypothetical protein
MKNFSLLLTSTALGAALLASSPPDAAAQSAGSWRGGMFTGRSAEVAGPAMRCHPVRPYWLGTPVAVPTWRNEWWWRHHGWGWGGYGALYALGLGGIGADYPYWDYYPQDYYDNAWGSPYYYTYTYYPYDAAAAPPVVTDRTIAAAPTACRTGTHRPR